jgi:acyl carrier protein phosphodiesterase
LFGFDYDDRLMLSFTRHDWIDAACGMLGPALATLCLAIDDVKTGDLGANLSGELTTDLVWFMARSALILTWVDWDRASRLDFTNALPVMPLCREVVQMATRRIAMGKGLDQRVAESWRKALSRALHDLEQDTPLNRLIRAELEQERSTAAPTTPL